MKLSKKRKDIIETLYMEYYGPDYTLSGRRRDVIEFLRDAFGLSKRQASDLIDFVRYEGVALPSYSYYVENTKNVSDIWDYYYEYRKEKNGIKARER